MLDTHGLHQGAGLRQWASPQAPQLMSLVHHGDTGAEMAALWQISAAFQALGYPVTVLDGMTEESPGTPGLLELAYPVPRPRPRPMHDTGITVCPAARGLAQLSRAASPEAVLHTLAGLFREWGVILVYAPTELLAKQMLTGGLPCPVLAVEPSPSALLSAYASLKALAASGPLRQALLVTVRTGDESTALVRRMARSMQSCTMKYLNCRLQHIDLGGSADSGQEARGLALRLLERSTSAEESATPHRMWSH